MFCVLQIYHDIYTYRKTTFMCIAIWVFCLSLQIPSYFGLGDYKYLLSFITFVILLNSYNFLTKFVLKVKGFSSDYTILNVIVSL